MDKDLYLKKQELLRQFELGCDSNTLSLVNSSIQCAIDELRSSNDTAEGGEVLRNQGGIKFGEELIRNFSIKKKVDNTGQ